MRENASAKETGLRQTLGLDCTVMNADLGIDCLHLQLGVTHNMLSQYV